MTDVPHQVDHEEYMRRAIKLALSNPLAPFGALLVDREQEHVVAKGLNQVKRNPLLHGEIDAINQYAERGEKRWSHLRLYTTAEPCCMCQAAVIWAGIPEVIYGTSIATLAELGWKQFDLTSRDVSRKAPFARCSIVGGILALECDRLFIRNERDQ